MNGRIQEIADMAQICANNLMASGATEEQIQERFKQVFAELIVRECAGVADSLLEDNTGSEVMARIKEHFGVE